MNYLRYGLAAALMSLPLYAAAADIDITDGQLTDKHSIFQAVDDASQVYTAFKKKLHDRYGFDYVVRAGFLMQRGAPNGKNTVFRDKYEVEANWDMFQSAALGSGSIQLLYEDINYEHMEATAMQTRLGIITPMNDDAQKREYFKRLTYTHQLPGKMNWLSVSVGQFLIGSFGKVSYLSKPMYHFNNFSLSKNMTKAYPTGGLGGYITMNIRPDTKIILGAQDTTNYFPQNVAFNDIDKSHWTNFIYAQYRPKWFDFGRTVITGWISHSPNVDRYTDGGQLKPLGVSYNHPATGWMLNLRQDFGKKWTIFAKINGATGSRMCMDQSYALDVMYNNPFNRNPLDQLGIGFAANKVSKMNLKAEREWESIAEAYWAFGISDFMTITPDVQIYINPALDKNRSIVTVSSLTAKLYF